MAPPDTILYLIGGLVAAALVIGVLVVMILVYVF